MRDSNEKYVELVKGVTGGMIIIALVVWFLLCSGCKLMQDLTKSQQEKKSDSAAVSKESEEKSNGETSKSKSEATNTKETIYQPQPIYIQGKDGKTEIVFVPQSVKETGTNKQENETIMYELWKRNYQDSVNKAETEKNKDKHVETTVKTDWLTIGMIVAIALLFLKNFISIKLPFKIKTNE